MNCFAADMQTCGVKYSVNCDVGLEMFLCLGGPTADTRALHLRESCQESSLTLSVPSVLVLCSGSSLSKDFR